MPWHVGPQGGGTCGPSQWPVIKDSDGSTVGCHPSKKAAQAQVAALYANEPGAKMTLPDCTAAGELAESPAHFRASSVDNSAWDGPAAMSGCTHSGTPASCFSSICAGKKSGDTATQAAWALPHHKNPGGPPNAAGVSAALSRLPQTQGLTNAAAAKAHLQAHAHAINPDYEAAAGFGLQRGVAIRGGSVARMPNQGWRSQPFGGQMRAQTHTKSGIEYLHLEGYATVFDLEYDMWDMFGIYWESVDPGAFARSLGQPGLDVAFLLNHRGMTMARTTGANPSLRLSADDHGLAVDADLRMTGRSDVVNLAAAIDEGLIDEMSFAFMLTAGEWDEEYMHFQITEADINRGDVSAVNYGANPYTSIASRAPEILRELDVLPAGAARAALSRLSARPDMGGLARDEPPGEELAIGMPTHIPGLGEPAQLGSGHGSFTGSHSHEHPAYGAQGADLSHEHAHEHTGDGQHTHSHGKAAPEPPPAQRSGPMSVGMLMAMHEADNAADADEDAERLGA